MMNKMTSQGLYLINFHGGMECPETGEATSLTELTKSGNARIVDLQRLKDSDEYSACYKFVALVEFDL